jgi:hypothetical protein
MTEFEKNCYGITEAQIRRDYLQGITARLSGLEITAMAVLSDAQEMLMGGASKDAVRKQINIAKFILCEIHESKQTA